MQARYLFDIINIYVASREDTGVSFFALRNEAARTRHVRPSGVIGAGNITGGTKKYTRTGEKLTKEV